MNSDKLKRMGFTHSDSGYCEMTYETLQYKLETCYKRKDLMFDFWQYLNNGEQVYIAEIIFSGYGELKAFLKLLGIKI
jgi:hypothetical protein